LIISASRISRLPSSRVSVMYRSVSLDYREGGLGYPLRMERPIVVAANIGGATDAKCRVLSYHLEPYLPHARKYDLVLGFFLPIKSTIYVVSKMDACKAQLFLKIPSTRVHLVCRSMYYPPSNQL